MLRPILLALVAGTLTASALNHADIKAEYGPDAPALVVTRLQGRVQEDPSPLYGALPSSLKAQGFALSISNTPRGVDVQIQVAGSAQDAKAAAEAIARPLTDLAQEEGGDFAERTTVRGEGFAWPGLPELPSLPLSAPGSATAGVAWIDRVRPLAGALAALGLAALLVGLLRRRKRGSGKKMPMATLWGAPVLGLLPESLARVGKLYHLQSKPCQALAYYFGQHARDRREVAIVGPTAEATGTVAVCLGLFLAKEGEKVLLVDMAQDNPVIPSILARFGPPPEVAQGASETAIPDLDLWVAPSSDRDLPALPEDLARAYVRILYVPAPGARPKRAPVIEIAHKISFAAGLKAALRGKRVGWVLFGDSVPMRISDRYFTRYYYERLHDVSRPAATSLANFEADSALD